MECVNPSISVGDKHRVSELTKETAHTYASPGEWKGKEESHVPVITLNADKTMLVQVNHEMKAGPTAADAHFIEWIFVLTESGALVNAVHLDPESASEAILKADVPVEDNTSYIPYSYCNKHGLWKGEKYTPGAAA